jgi:hypothetical protein
LWNQMIFSLLEAISTILLKKWAQVNLGMKPSVTGSIKYFFPPNKTVSEWFILLI